jgi:hypothetical protein
MGPEREPLPDPTQRFTWEVAVYDNEDEAGGFWN